LVREFSLRQVVVNGGPAQPVDATQALNLSASGWPFDGWRLLLMGDSRGAIARVSWAQVFDCTFVFMEQAFPMKKIALAAATVSILIAGAASAADMAPRYTKAPPPPPVAVYNWTGFYIGAHAGAGWSTQDATSADPGSDLARGRLDSGARVIAGVHAGYNWQVQRFVLGVEADGTWTDLRAAAFDTNRFPNGAPVGSGGVTFTDRVNWLATIRGRAGFLAAPQFLLYVTGGGAWGDVNYHTVDIHAAGPASPATFDFSGGRSGWVAGAGGEWMFSPNWIARLEYLHYELDGASATGIPRVGFPAELSTFVSSKTKIDTVRAGLSYKFGGPVVAKY
jgi:outer membrane immunogenic protein